MTAAHRELPLGTVIRVHRLSKGAVATGQSVDVRINDRGPYGPGRILDLSLAAARALDMVQKGVVLVEVQVLSVPEKRRKRR